MAFQKRIELASGIVAEEAYVRISYLTGTKTYLSITAEVYLNKNIYDKKGLSLCSEYYSFEPTTIDGSVNFIAQAYKYLKTHPDFKDAIEV
jgi:S-adenosylmethionine synthetase